MFPQLYQRSSPQFLACTHTNVSILFDTPPLLLLKISWKLFGYMGATKDQREVQCRVVAAILSLQVAGLKYMLIIIPPGTFRLL